MRKEYIDFYVKDTGMGISEEKIKMIFERFVKLNTLFREQAWDLRFVG